ncbi:hypothetical protein [Vreelandella profundi]|uniref:hypothetical protein n=1 Tax=Vreelandella profundi TaxID=2852117 RepID=UPI001F1DC240|nr:hypothetical protein [Halomonas profundi]|tara:strand:- start:783 stop:1184 length:402 start_codon:yes stop_codon:yes gene_type:complete
MLERPEKAVLGEVKWYLLRLALEALEEEMKVIEKVEVDTVTDVVCDVCLCSTRVENGGLEFATLSALWGYGTRHDGERYELHLCEDCFFQAVADIRKHRRIENLFNDDYDHNDNELGLMATDDYFHNGGISKP